MRLVKEKEEAARARKRHVQKVTPKIQSAAARLVQLLVRGRLRGAQTDSATRAVLQDFRAAVAAPPGAARLGALLCPGCVADAKNPNVGRARVSSDRTRDTSATLVLVLVLC